MARDYFDESKKKKKDEKTAVKEEQKSLRKIATQPQSSSVKNVNDRANRSTFMGGTETVPRQNVSSERARQASSNAIQRSQKSTFMGGTETRPSSSTSSTRAREAADNAIERSRRSTYMGGTDHTKRRTAMDLLTDDIKEQRRTLGQAQKSGDYDRVDELTGRTRRRTEAFWDSSKGTSKRTARDTISEWDKDIADTITHTVKQGLAGDARVLNRSMQGITQKDAFLYTTQEQRNKADAKVAARDKRLAQTIENETQALEDIQNKHGYIGKQALSAVSSVTGMGMDIAAGAVAPGSSLAHMWMRSTGTSMGQVNRKAENLRRQLKATGQYTDRELDEMFSNVDALDMANAAASGGIEVLSELLFPGVGAARKVIGGKGMSLAERAGAKLFNKVGAKASGGFLKNLLKGTAEEVAEEEIGGPLQALSSNLIYGNKFQGYQEDSIKKSLTDQSNALRSQVHSEEEARAAAARLSSQTFMDDSTKMYQESGYSKEESERLAELSREYLTASLSGDVDAMKQYQDEMVAIMAGGENSQKEKFTFQDAIDAAVSTSMMTLTTGLPGAISTMQVGNAYKENAGLNAVKQQAEMIRNWGEEKDKAKAQAIIDHIDNGGDLSGTQVYEIIQKSGELAEENREPERIKNQIASAEMGKRDLRISPISQDGVFAPQTQQRYEQIVNSTIARYDTLAKIGEDTGFDKTDVAIGANIGAAFETGVITSEMVNELATGSAAVKAVFEDVTGINLEQFDSYTEMNHALMAEAAQNMVNSARLEQAAWNDESRKEMSDYITKDVGGSGDLAVQNALEAVDPRDRTMFLMTGDVARSVYDYARKTDASWSEVRSMYKEMYPSVNYDSLEDVYKAAKQDKQIAETNGYGKIVGNNTKNSLAKAETAYVPGKYTDARQVRDGGLKEESLLKSIARAFGINVKVVDDLGREAVDKDGNAVVDEFGDPVIIQDNGYYDSANNTLVINAHPDATRTITQTMSHELTHHIAVHAPNEYVKLNRYIMDAWYRQDPSGFNRAIEQKQAQYKRIKNQDLSVEQALEEIIADGAADFNWADEQFIQDVTVNDPTLADRIIEAIKDVLRRIREILASGDVIDEASREALYDKAVEFSEVQKLWMNAAQAARKERASQAIDEWQNSVNQQNSTRKWSPNTEEKTLPKGAALPKRLEKWAKEIGLDTLTNQDIKAPVQVSVRDLRSAWYEMNGRSEEAEVINEALSSVSEALTNLVGEYKYIDLGDAINATVHYRADASGKPTSVILSCQVKNAEYEVNFDFTTICAKRLAMQKVLEKFIKTEGKQKDTLYDELKLDEEGMYKLRLILEQAGFEVSCKGCFVEQNRYSQQAQAKEVADAWNAAVDAYAAENGIEITDNFDLANLDINSLDYEAIEAGFKKYHELMKGKSNNVENKNRTLIEAIPYFRKRMNPSDYASLSGQRALMAMGEAGGTNLYNLLKRGQGYAKQSVPFTAYNGEVALLPDKMKNMDLYDYLISIGGARAQSASDFQIEYLFDYMQMVADLSARGLPMHMYTKVIELAELFGMTGIKINLSAMCDVDPALTGEYAGLKLVDGKYEYNISDQSIDYPKAVELQKKDGYSKNIGIIMVALSSQHMLKSLDDPNVRYIIGYHSSKMPAVVAAMSQMGDATDYTKINKTNKLNEKGQELFDKAMERAEGETELAKFKDALRILDELIQEDTNNKKGKRPRRGNEYANYMSAYKNNTADFNTYEHLKDTNDARKTADDYIEWCMDNGYIPLYFPFAYHENYYKCEVYDFNMYDNVSGEYAPMESAQNIYPGLDMTKGETDTTQFMNRVSEMMGERNAFNEVQSAMYEPVIEQAQNELNWSISGDDYMDFDASGIDHNELMHRADAPKSEAQIRDENYMSAVESGNMDEAQRLVDEAARMAGYNTPKLYHGTPTFGFTVFDNSKLDDGFSIFATNNPLTAETYSGVTNRSKISDRSTIDVDKLNGETLLNEASKYRKKYSDYRLMTPAEQERMLDESRAEVKLFAQDVAKFIEENKDSFDEEKLAIANRIEESINRISTAWADDMVDSAWDDFENAMWDLKWMDESIQMELMQAIQAGGSLQYWKNTISDMMYSGDIYRNKTYENEYIFDNQLALELESDLSKGIYGLYGKSDNQLIIDTNGENWNAITPPEGLGLEGPQKTRWIAEAARNKGYDSILFKNLRDNGGETPYNGESDVYIFFNPNQVKSADTITYAEDGSVIPLSERFDPNNDDIRYSLPTTDSDGNVLTDGQMEYFKNSQARDEQGRLVPVYHTTNRGGFTIFDPWYSNDHRSLFFASNWDVSQTYGRNASKAFDLNAKRYVVGSLSDLQDAMGELLPDGYKWDTLDDVVNNLNITAETDDGFNLVTAEELESLFDEEDFALLADEDSSGYTISCTIPSVNGKEKQTITATNQYDFFLKIADALSTSDFRTRGYYEVYLNLENPLIVDAQGQNWNEIPYGTYNDDAVLAIKNLTVQDLGNSIYVNIWGDKKIDDEWKEFRESTIIDANYMLIDGEYEIPSDTWDKVYDFMVQNGIGTKFADANSDSFFELNTLETFDKDGNPVKSESGRYRTRELAEIAQQKGHDGVIIKNCYDLGGQLKHGASALSDIYIAFSSNQVKDINNENPTENPDIRYSMASEDETLGYLMQNAEDITDIPLADALLEDNRVRYALSATDFENSIITSWDRRTRNLAEEVQETPLKNELIRLMRQVRKDSGTERQYKSETIEETIRSLKKMYYYAKGDKAKEFAREAWDAAERIVDDIDYNDELYKQYQGITDYFANYRINLSEDIYNAFGNYKNDEIKEDFEKFIKDSSGKIRFSWEMFSDRSDDVELHYAYNNLSKEYPELFPSDKDNPIDQLLQMDYVLNLTDPYRDAYTSEEHSKLVEDIANNLCNIVDEGNEYKAAVDDLNVKAMKQRHQEAIRKIKEVEKQKRTYQIERAEKWKARYNERVKQNQADKEAGRQKKNEKKLVGDIEKNIKWLSDRLRPETRTKDNAIPEQFRSALGALLAEFDLQTKGSKKLEKKKGYPSKVTLRMRNLRDQYEAIAKEKDEDGDNIFRYNGDLLEKMNQLIKTMEALDNFFDKHYGREVTIADLSLSEMFIIDTMLKSLVHEFREYKNVTIENKRAEIADVSSEVMGDMDTQISRHGQAREGGALGKISGLLNMAEVTPVYFFKRLGAMYKMYRELRKGFDKYIENDREVINRLSKIMSGYYNKKNPGTTIESWRTMEDAQTFNFEHGSVTLSVAQMMEIYLYANRPQAYAHLTGDGIIVSPITPSGKIANAKEALLGHEPMVDPVRLSYEDIQEIVSKLTEEQINMANKLQELVAGYMSDLGNETTMKLYGYKMFDDPNYFGIHVSQTATSSSVDAPALTETIKNFGWTKPLAPGAKNAMVIGDIFTDVARYCNEMNQFNAYAVPVSDFMRVYNYKQRDEEGNFTSVKGSIQKAFGKQAHTYIMNFLRDLNGASMRRNGGLEGLIDSALGKAKKAAVFMNMRVALQQPTAIVRALAQMNAKYFVGVRPSAAATKEMIEHCPIAQWKAWGFYDTHFGRDVEDLIMNNWSKADVVGSWIYGALDNMTWGMIWQAVKKEVKADIKARNLDVKEGSQEFWDMCNDRASFVFDSTQVVDSPFHRSDAMRSKDTLIKQFTSFQAEPTLSFNVVRDFFVQAYDAVADGDKGKAAKLIARGVEVWTLQAAVVAVAQSLWDAVRHKHPDGDDDEEEKFLMLWWENFMSDFVDDMKLYNNIYFIKEFTPYAEKLADYMKTGKWSTYDNNKLLMFQGAEKMAQGLMQIMKKIQKGDDYKHKNGEPYTWYEVMTSFLGGVGYLFGVPAGTVMRDAASILEWFNIKAFAADTIEKPEEEKKGLFERAANKMGYRKKEKDAEASEISYDVSADDLPGNLTDEQKEDIVKAGERRAKKNADKEEEGQLDYDTMLYKAMKASAGLEGEDFNKAVYSSVAQGLKGYVADGDYQSIGMMRTVIEQAGGDVDYFDSRVLAETKSAYKKTLNYDQSVAEYNDMRAMYRYMANHGMSQEDISAIVYESDMAKKDLKVAYILGDEGLIAETMTPLLNAGISRNDLEKIYKNRNRIDLMKYKENGGRYAEKLKSRGTFIWPTQGTITSHFGYRNAPTRGASSNHPAIDIGAPQGTSVVAADGGVVISAGANGGYGNSVGIKHDNGMITWYNHLYSWNVKEGDTVAQGQQIAQVGSTGISTGPHLDFKIMDANGEPVDPEQYLQ